MFSNKSFSAKVKLSYIYIKKGYDDSHKGLGFSLDSVGRILEIDMKSESLFA